MSFEFFLPHDTWPIDTSTHSPNINSILSLGFFEELLLNMIVIMNNKCKSRVAVVPFPSMMQNHILGSGGGRWECVPFSVFLQVHLSICIGKNVFLKYIECLIYTKVFHEKRRTKKKNKRRKGEIEGGRRMLAIRRTSDSRIIKAHGPNFKRAMLGTALLPHRH